MYFEAVFSFVDMLMVAVVYFLGGGYIAYELCQDKIEDLQHLLHDRKDTR
jgi:hypothetical protein